MEATLTPLAGFIPYFAQLESHFLPTTLLAPLVTLVGFLITYFYDRGRRYNYLADRWNTLMTLNADEQDFFDAQNTCKYLDFSEEKLTKYNQHARLYWGFVEDIVRNDYLFEHLLPFELFVGAYSDSIKNVIGLHNQWLADNKDKLFTYQRFRKVLKKKFDVDL